MLKISIIGFGRVGSHLYYALKASKKFEVNIVSSSRRDNLDTARLAKSDIIFICTADKDISDTAGLLKKNCRILRGKVVLHTSGAKDSYSFNVLLSTGVSVGSFHPVQTFSKKARKYTGTFKNIFVAVEGNKKAVETAFRIALVLEARPFEISAERKVFHHICCVMASNYLVTLLGASEAAYKKIRPKGILKNGFNKTNFFDIYKPLIEQTLKNIAVSGVTDSLTGPIERNDLQTVDMHMKALKRSLPELIPLYTNLGIETVKAALKKKSLNNAQALGLIKLLNK